LENAAIENINKARDVSQIGYVPYYGPDVAAFSPMQQQSMQSTGNAASAFGLAPQGFDAMAGMPQAQTFAGGVQGYSSAPLYEQSLDKLYANAPAQYNAMNNMFIDPFTGARPQGDYAASPAQVSQMFSNSGDGGVSGSTSPVGGAFGPDGNNDGEYFGVNSQYNPYKYDTPDTDRNGDGNIDYYDMSFGEAGRRDVGFGENIGNMIKGVTGIGAIESAIDYGQGLADGFTPSPFDNGLLSQTSGPSMTPEESMRIVNEKADRYERLSNDRGFKPAVPFNGPQPAITPEIGGGLLRGTPLDNLNNEYALQTALRDEELAQELAKKVAIDTRAKREAANRAAANRAASAKKAADKKAADKKAADKKAAAAAAAAKSTVNSGGDGRGARQRDRNSSGGGYGGGGDSYDPSGRF
jgi:hypothetical protein